MTTKTNGNQFREDEILVLDQLRDGNVVRNIYPKIGGRLRLAHEDNEQLSISTEIVRYDEVIAVVKAVTSTMKGSFPGFGMASVERDREIAPAILELAETRAIARSLRFSGYGIEYSGFEEISHLQNGCSAPPQPQEPATKPPQEGPKGGNGEKPGNGGNGGDKGGGNGGNGDIRISNKQLSYIVDLGKSLKLNSKDLDQETVKTFGVKMSFMTSKQASTFIDQLKGMSALST